MVSNCEGLSSRDPPFSSWEKVTRKIVDPITFSCRFNVTYIPRIEDCSYETTTVAIGEPRFGGRWRDSARSSSSSQSFGGTKNTHDDNAWRPHDFSNNDNSSHSSGNLKGKNSTPSHVKPSKNHVKPTKSGGASVDKGASLGAFFSKDAVQKVIDFDNQSLSSRSMNSRSVSERSNAERSKAEEKIKLRRVHRTDGAGTTSSITPEIKGMMSIDEQNAAEFSERKSRGGMLEQFLNETSTSTFIDVENRSLMSASTIGTRSVSLLSVTDRSKQEKVLKSTRDSKSKEGVETQSRSSDPNSKGAKSTKPTKVVKSILKKSGPSRPKRKLEFQEGHDICEVPPLSDKEWYRDWDDIWYTEDEIGDMRYAAFLEEAGLDVDEYMNM